MSTATLIRQLTASMNDTLSAFKLSERDLKRHYRKGGWTVREVLLHLSDTECVFLERTRRIIAEDRPLFMTFDPDAWIAELGKRDLVQAAMLFEVSRMAIIDVVRARYSACRTKFGIHNRAGKLTLQDQIAKIIDHTDHHNSQIAAALRK